MSFLWSHLAITCSWNWPIYSEESGRRGGEGRGCTGRGNERVFIDCVTGISATVLFQSVLPEGSKRLLPLSALPVFPPPASGGLWRTLWGGVTAKHLQGAQFQPLSLDKLNDFPEHFWFQKCDILFSSSTHTVSSRPRKESSTFTHSVTQLRMGFGSIKSCGMS